MSSLFHKHLWKFREGGEKNTFGKKYHRMQVKDFFSELLFLLFLLVLVLFPELGCCTTWWENQVKVRLAYCWMWKMADLKLFLGKSSSIGDYLLPPLSLFPCPKRQIIWNWSNRFQAGHAQIVSTSAGSASSAVAKPNSEVFKGFFSCLFPNTDRTGAISRRSITFRRRLSMIRAHTTILKKAIIPWNCRWLCLLQLQWRKAHQDSWKRCEGCQDQGCAH